MYYIVEQVVENTRYMNLNNILKNNYDIDF